MSIALCSTRDVSCTVSSVLIAASPRTLFTRSTYCSDSRRACRVAINSARTCLNDIAAMQGGCVTVVWFVNVTGRRSSKLVSLVTSCFTGNYVRSWPAFFPQTPLRSTPIFDGRAVCYPSDRLLRDYLSWRQADTHINNQVSQHHCASQADEARL
jgi:tRNAHis guanylyltransferase/Thg1 C terminal domain